MLTPWKIVATKTIHTTPWIEILEDECLAGQTPLSYTYTKRIDEGPLIIAETAEQKLWLVRQYRHPIKKIIWQFPAEGKHVGEGWEEAARRGLSEELQLTAEELVDMGAFHPDPGGLEQTYHAFLATGLSPTDSQDTEHSASEIEELETQCFSLAEIDELITAGEICDNWTLAGLFLYQRYKKTTK